MTTETFPPTPWDSSRFIKEPGCRNAVHVPVVPEIAREAKSSRFSIASGPQTPEVVNTLYVPFPPGEAKALVHTHTALHTTSGQLSISTQQLTFPSLETVPQSNSD